MGAGAKGASACSTLILMFFTLQMFYSYMNTAEYQLNQLFQGIAGIFGFGSGAQNPQIIIIMIILLGVISIAGAAKG